MKVGSRVVDSRTGEKADYSLLQEIRDKQKCLMLHP